MIEPRTDELKAARHRLVGMASGAALLGGIGVVSAARAAAARRTEPTPPEPLIGA
ncbi:hypothetical protein [Catenuloplanes atrovinosus]|uniref:Uncharacterized protein n=1 Tax=Catenuloplanes atrovinosus TaxID=137266 RepID=A0AAE4CG58_9ACTN|nr:hypothetical protein [Catenuloplanes atrovinosus]MDR7280365.1 hypothetical protein [Catenuloplanes atrovinosus]